MQDIFWIGIILALLAASLGYLSTSPDLVQRLIAVVRQVLDRRRFAWVVEGREPTEAERNAAVMASAALMAASRAQTRRRGVPERERVGFLAGAATETPRASSSGSRNNCSAPARAGSIDIMPARPRRGRGRPLAPE